MNPSVKGNKQLNYQEFRRFMLDSNKLWKKKYPKFRSNYQGDKIIGYALVRDHVRIPKQYHHLDNMSQLTTDIIQNLGAKPFVIKSTLGHQGNKVLCIIPTSSKEVTQYVYQDIMRSSDKHMTLEELIIYANKRLISNTVSKIIIEEYVGASKHKVGSPHIPIDYKAYTVLGKVKIINLYIRGPQGKFMACFDNQWNRIPLDKFYLKPIEIGYTDFPGQMPLPPQKKRQELIKTAEKLAKVHKARFCRYDFYYEKDRIYFGEITPVCGGIKNHDLTKHVLKIFCM